MCLSFCSLRYFTTFSDHYYVNHHLVLVYIHCRFTCSEPNGVVVRRELKDTEAFWGQLGVPAAAR